MSVVRTCVGCRERAVAAEMLRVVVVSGAGGLTVVPDSPRRLPGRGASLHLDAGCLALAERRRAFLRAFRVRGPLDLTVLREHIDTQQRSTAGPT
ncbi:MAG: DUF448 domain-containing protein [Pseudonocardiales bacterium]|nr:MAG: DUF448 domain-containing protein [Pseudonocardiales bacterium]